MATAAPMRTHAHDPHPPRWLTYREASAYSGISIRSLRRLVDGGKLRVHAPLPRKHLFDRVELDAYLGAS